MGDEVTETKRQVARMAVDTKAPGQSPPDLPSLLLDGRICYIGMPVGWGAATNAWGDVGPSAAGQLQDEARRRAATAAAASGGNKV